MIKERKSSMNEDNEIKELNQLLYEEAKEHNETVKDSMLVATAYIAVGTRILRTCLDQDNYKRFMTKISNEDVKPLETHKTIH